MSVLPPRKGNTSRRLNSKGVVMQDVSRGVERTRVWPKKRGKNLPEKTKEQMELFRQIQWAAKFMDARVYQTLATAVKNSPIMPRDFWMMLYSGRAYAFQNPDGSRIYSMAVVKDVSESLDVLCAIPGMMLIRGAELWEGVDPPPTPPLPIYAARIYRQAAWATIGSGNIVVLPMDTISYDPQGWYDSIGFTPPAGRYRIDARINAVGTVLSAGFVFVGGVNVMAFGENNWGAGQGAVAGSCIVEVDGTQSIQVASEQIGIGAGFPGSMFCYLDITGPYAE